MALLSDSSVIDNLDSNDSKRPLSARMGGVIGRMLSTISKSTHDTGWVDLTQALITGGKNAEAYYPEYPARIRRIGSVVYLDAMLRKITGSQPATVDMIYKLFNLPEGFYPSREVVKICQGSAMNKFCVRIDSSGGVYLCRYGSTNTSIAIPVDAWLPINIEYCV